MGMQHFNFFFLNFLKNDNFSCMLYEYIYFFSFQSLCFIYYYILFIYCFFYEVFADANAIYFIAL